LPYVQFWEAENSGRLDSSRRWGHRRAISCLVDASNLRTVNAIKILRVKSMSVMANFIDGRLFDPSASAPGFPIVIYARSAMTQAGVARHNDSMVRREARRGQGRKEMTYEAGSWVCCGCVLPMYSIGRSTDRFKSI
jgi:hypothetical protein